MALTAVATVGAGDELLWLLIAILLLGPQTEAADGDGLRHRLAKGQSRREEGGDAGEKKGEGKKKVETVSQLNSFIVQMKTNKVALCVPLQRMTVAVCIKTLTVN